MRTLDQRLYNGQDAIDTATVQDVVTSMLSNTAPMTEATGGAAGAGSQIPRHDHAHPRPVSVTYATISSGSTVQVNFTRLFASKPGIDVMEIEAVSAQPAMFAVQSWVQDGGGNYTGCVIKAWRAQVIPQNLATLLLGAVFNLFGASVVGVQFSCIAVLRSDV